MDEAPLKDRHQAAIRTAVAAAHLANGTRHPSPDAIEVEMAQQRLACVRVGNHDAVTGFTIHFDDDIPTERAIDSLIALHEHRHRWRNEASRSADRAETEIALLARQANATCSDIISSQLTRSGGKPASDGSCAVKRYRVHIEALGHALKPEKQIWEIAHDLVTDEWTTDRTPTQMSDMRANARRVRAGEELMVCAMLADWMKAQPDQTTIAKLLFAAAQGKQGTKVPHGALTNLEARHGRIIGTIGMGPWYEQKARMRGGEIIIKGQKLPQTVCASAVGRRVNAVIEHPQFGSHIIAKMLNVREGLVITTKTAPVSFAALWKEIDE